MKLPNGYGSIYKLSGTRRKPFIVRKTIGYEDNGKQIKKVLGYYETRNEALQALALYNDNPYDIDTKRITLENLYNKWKAEHFAKIAPKTQVVYKMCWNYCQEIKDTPFVNLKLMKLQEIVDSMGTKWSAKKAFKVFFNQLYDFATMHDINIKKYSQFIDLGKKATKLERIPFEKWEIDVCWEKINRMDFIDTILILLYTGMRVGEMFDIKLENVHIKERYMIGGSKTDAGKNRIIPIHEKIVPIIEKYYNLAKECNCEYLVVNSLGTKMQYSNYRREKWDKMIEQLELQKGHKPHDTRHTFISEMNRLNVNKVSVQRIVGHASKDVTDKVYTHKDIEDLVEAVNKLEY